jgi:hypothetical protein
MAKAHKDAFDSHPQVIKITKSLLMVLSGFLHH